MGDTAELKRLSGTYGKKTYPESKYGEGRSGTDLASWSGELPLRLIAYLDRINPWDLRGLSGVVIRFPETREVANIARLLHHVIEYAPRRAAEGRWRFGEALDFKVTVNKSIRNLHRIIHQASQRGRIFMNSNNHFRREEPRHD